MQVLSLSHHAVSLHHTDRFSTGFRSRNGNEPEIGFGPVGQGVFDLDLRRSICILVLMSDYINRGTDRTAYEHELMSEFDEMMDECYPDTQLMGMTFTPSNILKSDSIAYREYFNNWIDSEGWDEA